MKSFLTAWLFATATLVALATSGICLASASKAPVILVYGDSLSAEYGLPRGAGWVALMEQRLKQLKIDYSVANASISGETTAGGAARINTELARIQPAIVIIELGGNDGLRGLALAATRANLESMIEAASKAGARVLLCGMQLPPNYGRDFTERFRAMYGELANRHKVAMLPFFLEGIGERRELFQSDGIHPVAEAQPRILDNVWVRLVPLLKAPRK